MRRERKKERRAEKRERAHLLLNRTDAELDVNRAVSLRARLRERTELKGTRWGRWMVSECSPRASDDPKRRKTRPFAENSPTSPLPLHLPLLNILPRQLNQHRCEILLFLKPSPNAHQLPRPRSTAPRLYVSPPCSNETHLDRVFLVLEEFFVDGVRNERDRLS